MKRVALAALVLVALPAVAQRDTRVNGYTRRDGTSVQPYHRTAPNNTNRDNYSTQGNVNPWTGKEGTKKPDSKW